MESWNSFLVENKREKIAVLDIAYDENSSFLRGAAEAPSLIRQAFFSPASNLWTENEIDLGEAGLLVDAGIVKPEPGKDVNLEIETTALRVLDYGLSLVSLGGDHAITYPLVKAVSKHYPDLSILHFDAHPDLYDEFDGNRWSHAYIFTWIMEQGLVKRLVQVGIRGMNGHQRSQAERFGVEVISMQDFSDNLELHFKTPVYISFDMDCLDPAFAPGVSHWEPGGLSTRQMLHLIQTLDAPLVAADIDDFIREWNQKSQPW